MEIVVFELKAFMGLCILMGILRLPSRRMYWRTTGWLQTRFTEIMSGNRFDFIWKYIHLANNANDDKTDKLFKVRPLIDMLKSSFKGAYQPNTFTIDESMIPFKGRLGFKQYMPAKPTKWGIKMFSLCESLTGYLYDFDVYTGKDATAPGEKGKGLSYKIVKALCNSIIGHWCRVVFDNWFTGIEILEYLKSVAVHACGTVRANRKGLPKNLIGKKLGKLGKHVYKIAQKGVLLFVAWKDTKVVNFLSNFHNPGDTGHVSRKDDNRQTKIIKVPQVVDDYQLYMRGVDKMDQMVSYYLLTLRGNKWWRRLFFYLFQVSLHNTYVFAKSAAPDVTTRYPAYLPFIEGIVEALIGKKAVT